MATSLTTCRVKPAVAIATNHALTIPHVDALGGRNERRTGGRGSSGKALKRDLGAADREPQQLLLLLLPEISLIGTQVLKQHMSHMAAR